MNFNNMIYVIDPNNISVDELSGKETYGGEFHFYYGLNEDTGYYEDLVICLTMKWLRKVV